MEQEISISLVQFNPAWEDKQLNMQNADLWLKKVPTAQNLVLFPEMFLTGFSMNTSKLAEPMDGEMVNWMKYKARQYNTTIVGSLPIIENHEYFNRLLIVSPDNKIVWYDKRHLFRMGEEQKNFTGGCTRILYHFKEWTILPLVCYDLRFPVWSRNKGLEYNILLYVANWPSPRNDAFLSLLKARAIENSSYVIGVNRVGTDGNGLSYLGNSVVFDPKGKVLAGMIELDETIINCTLSLTELNSYRDKFPVHLDADDFSII